MKWFGKSWGAAVCEPVDRIPVPIGKACFFCGHHFRRSDRGLSFPHIYKEEAIAHVTCFLRRIGRYKAAWRLDELT